jgi:hypothetical protein
MVIQRMFRQVCLSVVVVGLVTGCDVITGGGSAGSGGGSGGGGGGSATPSVSASLLEQLALERINRARLKPGVEAAAGGIAIDEGVPGLLDATAKEPVALNARLNQAARAHSEDMLNQNYFAHDAPDGTSPFDRISSAGYVYTAAGENLAWRGTTGNLVPADAVEAQHEDLFVDVGVADRGHRVTMLNADYGEIGIGIVRGDFTQNGTVFDSIMQTQDYGRPPSSGTFVLGVVYDDSNGNGQYDYNEGTANATVTLDTVVKSTNVGGGYSFEVSQAGIYTLRFASGQTQAVAIAGGTPNIKVDLVDRSTVVVNLGVGPLP